MSGTRKPGTQTLLTLADILGIPVDRFFDGESGSPATADMQECLRLWSCIRTDAGRERALTALRAIIASEQPEAVRALVERAVPSADEGRD